MEVTYYLFFLILLMCSGMDGVQTGNVLPLQPLKAIKKAGIRRPLMRNDQSDGIYLKSDQRQPPLLLTLRTPYYPRPLPPHRRLQPQQQQQQQQQQQLKQQGFILRNSIGRHPPRPAPVSINNHLGALTGGNHPGRGKFHHANRQPERQPLKQHPNHQFQTVNMPTNIHYNNKQPTGNHQQQQNGQILHLVSSAPTTIPPQTKSPILEEENPSKLMPDDADNLLKLELMEGTDYLTYLYLGMNETRLDEEYLKASANAGDKMTHPPADDDDIIIGSPTMHFDPYLSRNQSFRSKSSNEEHRHQFKANDAADYHQKTKENIIKSLEDDWLPVVSPWEKYANKTESKMQ